MRQLFAGRVLPVGEEMLLRWRLLLEAGRRGHTFDQPDLPVAATVAPKALVVVSRNTPCFIAAGISVLDPWLKTYTAAHGSKHAMNDLSWVSLVAQSGSLHLPH